jgi:hypothetical protein
MMGLGVGVALVGVVPPSGDVEVSWVERLFAI